MNMFFLSICRLKHIWHINLHEDVGAWSHEIIQSRPPRNNIRNSVVTNTDIHFQGEPGSNMRHQEEIGCPCMELFPEIHWM